MNSNEENNYVKRRITLFTKCPEKHWECKGGANYGVKCLGDLTNLDNKIKELGFYRIYEKWENESGYRGVGDCIGENIHVYASKQGPLSVIVLDHNETIKYDCLQRIIIHAPEKVAADIIKTIGNELAKMPPKFMPRIHPKGVEEEAMFSGCDWWPKLKYKPGPFD